MAIGTITLLAGAVGVGVLHAFEVDHMTAVSAFVARRPRPAAAVWFGIQWAVGHGASLLLLGSLLFAARRAVPESFASGLERVVGVALLGLGLWTLWALFRSAAPGSGGARHHHHHDDDHAHAGHSQHTHGSLWMGMLHGAAGTAAFVGETLVAVSQTYAMVGLYTLAFSLGVLLAMALYAGALGGLLTWGGHRLTWVSRASQALAGGIACAVGVLWIVR